MDKHYISATELLRDAWELAWMVYRGGYRPNYLAGVWRGGAPVGAAVHELLQVLGVDSDHIAVRASSYTGIGRRAKQVEVFGLDYLVDRVKADDRLLIVDDVYDTGLSIEQITRDLRAACGAQTPEMRIATAWYKPASNQTDRAPDYFVHETEQWLVFPHELDGLTVGEIAANKPELARLLDDSTDDSTGGFTEALTRALATARN